jgi:hypothetical protein
MVSGGSPLWAGSIPKAWPGEGLLRNRQELPSSAAQEIPGLPSAPGHSREGSLEGGQLARAWLPEERPAPGQLFFGQPPGATPPQPGGRAGQTRSAEPPQPPLPASGVPRAAGYYLAAGASQGRTTF